MGSALAGSDSEEAETEPTESNHPYAKVKKVRDHPYATVAQAEAIVQRHAIPEPPLVDVRPQPQQQQQYFSGDSQDSSKGYTSISVREPLRLIRGHNQQPSQQQNYVAVSEASDDMYAAIEDPTYLPTGNHSNSDTYAVINLPEDEDEEEVELRSANTYSQVDKSRKRKALSLADHKPNVDDMYAKVQKNVLSARYDHGYETVPASSAEMSHQVIDNLPMGASAMRTSVEQLGARPRSHFHVNYSDFEVTHYDLANDGTDAKKYEENYERVEDYWRGEDGYELVRGQSKSRFERLTFKKKDPGYETVAPPLPRMNNHPGLHPASDPPYARVEKDEEESEEGYETIPVSEKPRNFDPGYESVSNKISEPGYETVPMINDPGYETVDRDKVDHGYETVTGSTSLVSNNVAMVHMSVRKTMSDPVGGPNNSVVVIQHKTAAVNNNLEDLEEVTTQPEVQSHIFV